MPARRTSSCLSKSSASGMYGMQPVRGLEVAGWQERRVGYRLFRPDRIVGNAGSIPYDPNAAICSGRLLLGAVAKRTPSRAGSRRLFGDAQGSCRAIIAVLRLAAAGQPEHEQLACNGKEILPADASAFGFPDQLAGCLGGVPQGSSHKEAILVDNLQLVDEAGKDALIQAVAAYPSMFFVLCGRCPLPGWLAEYELAPRSHDRA